MKRIVIFFLFAAACAFAQTKPAANTFEVYPLGLSDGVSMEQMVKAVVGAEGTVTFDEKNRRLLVLATPEQHRQIAGMFTKTAVSPKNVRIEVVFSGGEIQTERGAGVGGQVGVVREEGITTTRWKVRPQVKDTRVETSSETRQQLLVSSGHEAMLRVGETVPYQTWLVDYGIAHGYIQQQIAWRDVGSFLVVQPTVIGDGPFVRVRVTPELVGTVNGSSYRTRFASVATEVTVSDGETVTIGGDAKDTDFYSRFLIGATRSGGTRSLTITMTPRIQSLPQAPGARTPAAGPQSQIPPTIKVWGEERQIPAGRP